MTRIKSPSIGKRYSRAEGWWKIYNTKKEGNNIVNIVDSLDYVTHTMIFRSIEGGNGIKLELEDADSIPPEFTPQQSIKISIDSSAISSLIGNLSIFDNGTFLGNVSALDFKGASVSVSGGKAFIEIITSGGVSHDIYVSGNIINSNPLLSVNFQGPVSANEASPGNVNIEIKALEGLKVEVDGSSYPVLIDTLNFKGLPDAISLSGKTVNIDLSGSVLSDMKVSFLEYSGPIINSGEAILSGFYGSDNPKPENTIVAINGLTLEYNTVSSISDFEINGNNLILKIQNVGYEIESGDKIISYFWF